MLPRSPWASLSQTSFISHNKIFSFTFPSLEKETLCDPDDIKNIDSESLIEDKTESKQKSSSFYTSTPKKQQFKCTTCEGKSKWGECDECYVDAYIRNLHKDKKKHFLMHDRL